MENQINLDNIVISVTQHHTHCNVTVSTFLGSTGERKFYTQSKVIKDYL